MIECIINKKKKKSSGKFIDIISNSKKNNIDKGLSVKNKKASASSKTWISRHINDFYVKRSLIDGFCSRAAYKLIEISHKYKIFEKKNMNVIDLGCSPGSWIQVLFGINNLNILKNNSKSFDFNQFDIKPSNGKISKLAGIDLISLNENLFKKLKNDLKKINDYDFLYKKENFEFMFIKNDFLNQNASDRILDFFNNEKCDLIISDISPNKTGNRQTDHLQSINIIQNIINFSEKILKNDGSLIIKMFHGEKTNEFLLNIKKIFKKIEIMKPSSSRSESSEFYLVCMK